MSSLNKQVGGNHYKDCAIQPIEYITQNRLGFIEGNIVKYVTRWREKGGIQDLEKVRHYVDLLIELEGAKETQRTEASTDTLTNIPNIHLADIAKLACDKYPYEEFSGFIVIDPLVSTGFHSLLELGVKLLGWDSQDNDFLIMIKNAQDGCKFLTKCFPESHVSTLDWGSCGYSAVSFTRVKDKCPSK